jgi:hypothetical protein
MLFTLFSHQILKFHFSTSIYDAQKTSTAITVGMENLIFRFFQLFNPIYVSVFANNSFSFLIIPIFVFYLFSHRHQCAVRYNRDSIIPLYQSQSLAIHFIVEFLFSLSLAGQQPLKCFYIGGCHKNVSRRKENTKQVAGERENHRKCWAVLLSPLCDNDTTCTHANKRQNTIKLFQASRNLISFFLSSIFHKMFLPDVHGTLFK